MDRERYETLNLRNVTPAVCLTHLDALVSAHPHAIEAVTPVRDFDLARYSFVESVDVVAGLDSRTALTQMTPTEFEHIVRQLFEARGLEGWTTDRVGDDGVDAVVLNRDPIVGGLTIVQAKKYTRVLGVQHIRELVGAMDEKRAGRGILVTTSCSRPAAGRKQPRTAGSNSSTVRGSGGSARSTSVEMSSWRRPVAGPPCGVRRRPRNDRPPSHSSTGRVHSTGCGINRGANDRRLRRFTPTGDAVRDTVGAGRGCGYRRPPAL